MATLEAAKKQPSPVKPAKLAVTRKMLENPRSRAQTATHAASQQKQKGGIWGRSQRFYDVKAVTPAPNAYLVPVTVNGRALGAFKPGYSMRKRTGGSIGTGFKTKSVDSSTPGPGMYNPKNGCISSRKKGVSFSPLLKSKTSTSPGPADYNSLVRPLGKSGQKYSFHGRPRSAWAADMSKASTNWRPHKVKSLNHSQSVPTILVADAPTPGPAAYNPLPAFGRHAAKKSMAKRLSSRDPSYPGPGAYQPHKVDNLSQGVPKYSLHARTKFKMGGSFIDGDTQNHRPDIVTPGPGAYESTPAFKTHSFNKLIA